MTNIYDDILDLPRHVSSRRKRMPLSARAAQFAPFAALTGYDSAIAEAGRRAAQPPRPSDEAREQLDLKLQYLMDTQHLYPQITVTYFIPDIKKTGGTYIHTTGMLKQIDSYHAALIFTDGTVIPLDCIADILC